MSAKLNTRQIEERAVSAVKDKLSLCNGIDNNFTEQDKNIGIDGEILIYNNEVGKEFSRDNFFGSFKVQIKGTTKTNLKRKSRYTVKRKDLLTLKKIGGAVFFAVYISETRESKVYYRQLNSLLIDKLLNRGKEYISEEFYPFPSNEKEIDALLRQSVDDLKVSSEMKISPDELKDTDGRFVISQIVPSSIEKENVIKYIEDKDIILYLEKDGRRFPVTLAEKGTSKIMEKLDIKKACFPNGMELNVNTYKNGDEIEVYIDGFSQPLIQFGLKNEKFHLKISQKDDVDKNLKIWECMYSCAKNKYVYLDDYKLSLKGNEESNKSLDEYAVELQEEIERLKKIKMATEALHINFSSKKKEYNVKRKTLDYLLNAFLDQENIKKEQYGIKKVEIGDEIHLIVISSMFVGSLYSEKFGNLFRGYTVEEGHDVTYNPYVLPDNSLPIERITDFNPNFVSDWFEKHGFDFEALDFYNDYCLQVISAFDRSENVEYLELAKYILKEIIKIDDIEHYRINLYQVINRMGDKYSSEQVKDIMNIYDNSEHITNKFAAAILLNYSQEDVSKVWKRLSRDEQKEMKIFPIWELTKKDSYEL